MKARALVLWVTATTVVLAVIPFVMLAFTLHHASRSAVGNSVSAEHMSSVGADHSAAAGGADTPSALLFGFHDGE